MFGLNLSIFNAFKYRDRATIVTDILKSVRNSRGLKKTQIMQSARLNHIQTEKYLTYMIGCGFLINEKRTYVVTQKGSKYLQIVEMQTMSALR